MKRQVVEVNGILCEVVATYFDEVTKKKITSEEDKKIVSDIFREILNTI